MVLVRMDRDNERTFFLGDVAMVDMLPPETREE